MQESYKVYRGQEITGEATVEKEGLYFRIRCRCELDREIMYKLLVTWDGGEENLGILAPVDGRFGLEKKVPAKRIPIEEITFHVVPRHQRLEKRFAPVYPEEPFSYLDKLKKATFATQDGQAGVQLPEENIPAAE